MKAISVIIAAMVAVAVSACGEDKVAALPPPHEPGPNAVGTVCRMTLSEHSGPKGQVFITSQDAPLWFSSVRDTFTWLQVDDGAGRQFAAIYVNDMARAKNWEQPEAGAWVEAKKAHFVIGSDQGADMGGSELVPFSDRGSAEVFVGRHGGTVVGFADITPELLTLVDVPAIGSQGLNHASRGHHE